MKGKDRKEERKKGQLGEGNGRVGLWNEEEDRERKNRKERGQVKGRDRGEKKKCRLGKEGENSVMEWGMGRM